MKNIKLIFLVIGGLTVTGITSGCMLGDVFKKNNVSSESKQEKNASSASSAQQDYKNPPGRFTVFENTDDPGAGKSKIIYTGKDGNFHTNPTMKRVTELLISQTLATWVEA